MKKFLTLCLVLLTAAALTVPAYADVIVGPTLAENAAQLVGILLVGLVIAVTAWLLQRFGKKR